MIPLEEDQVEAVLGKEAALEAATLERQVAMTLTPGLVVVTNREEDLA